MKKKLSTMIVCVVQALCAPDVFAFGPFTSAVVEVGGDDYTGYCLLKATYNSTSSCTIKNEFAIPMVDVYDRALCSGVVAAFLAGQQVVLWGNNGDCLDNRQVVRMLRINP